MSNSKMPRSERLPPLGRVPNEAETRRALRNVKALDVRKMIDKGFSRTIKIVERNKTETVTVFEAIVRQLSLRVAKGQKKAQRVLGLYQQFAFRGGTGRREIICLPEPKTGSSDRGPKHE